MRPRRPAWPTLEGADDPVVGCPRGDGEAALQSLKEAAADVDRDGVPAAAISARKLDHHMDDEEYGRAQSLIDLSTKIGAGLIVVGVHDGSKPLMGTLTERVLRETGCPVLIAASDRKGPWKKVVVAIDFSAYSKRALNAALTFAPGAELHLVHAYDPPWRRVQSDVAQAEGMAAREEDLKDMIGAQIDDLVAGTLSSGSPALHRHIAAGTPREVLSAKVKEIDPDLLVIGTHGRTGVVRAVLGSVATPFLDNPPCDVMAVKAW